MPRETLTMDSIGNLDHGTLRVGMNNALKLVTQDLHDRPSLDKARKIVLQLELKPTIDENSQSRELEDVKIAWQILPRIPAVGRGDLSAKPNQNGQLYFHSELPTEPDEADINDEIERKRREGK